MHWTRSMQVYGLHSYTYRWPVSIHVRSVVYRCCTMRHSLTHHVELLELVLQCVGLCLLVHVVARVAGEGRASAAHHHARAAAAGWHAGRLRWRKGMRRARRVGRCRTVRLAVAITQRTSLKHRHQPSVVSVAEKRQTFSFSASSNTHYTHEQPNHNIIHKLQKKNILHAINILH